jgi:hypothetical protein
MATRRQALISLESAITKFHAKIKCGPDYVCTVCHRIMYKQNVIKCNKTKYIKLNSDDMHYIFHKDLLYITFDGNIYVCKTCDASLLKGSLPVQAKANFLQLDPVPPELACLNSLEIRLISLRIAFAKMVALPVGRQKKNSRPCC